MKFSAVLFDLDGTLLYTLEDIADALNRTLAAHGMPERTLDEVRAFVGNGSARLVELSVPEKCSDEERQASLKALTAAQRQYHEAEQIKRQADALKARNHFAHNFHRALGGNP